MKKSYRDRAEALHARIDVELASMDYSQICAALAAARLVARAAEAGEDFDAIGLARLREQRFEEAELRARPETDARGEFVTALFAGVIRPEQW